MKNIKLKSILSESSYPHMPQPNDDTDVGEYINDFQELVVTKLRKLGNWESYTDDMTGTVYWNNSKFPATVIMATPFWEGYPHLPIDIIDDDSGDQLYGTKIVSFKPSYDKNKDLAKFKKLMVPFFKLAEKLHGKLKQ